MKKINIKSGKILYNDLNILNKSLSKQIFSLKEDLLQIEYPDGYLIDVGWYPEFDITGHFKIMLIKDFNWDQPVKDITCKDLVELIKNIQKIIDEIDNKTLQLKE